MRKAAHAHCPVCQSEGRITYPALRDRLFGAPDQWRMVECVNEACGTYWLDPAPHPEDLPLAYRSYYTHSQPEETLRSTGLRSSVQSAFLARNLGYPNRESLLARTLSYLTPLMPERRQAWLYTYFYLPWIKDGQLLEIGCGSGWQLARMKQAGWNTKGIDFDAHAADAARTRGLDVQVGDVRDLALEAASFDAIVMAHVLEHVFDPVGLLSECRRLLKPGGRLVSITPNGRSLGHRVFKSSWRGLEPPRHISVFTPKSLRLACTNAGMSAERVDVTARDAANLLLASARIRHASADAQIERLQFGKRPPSGFLAVAAVERLGNALGRGWGEELVLTARA